MSKFFDVILRSLMGIILSISAVVGALVSFPFLLIFWLYKQLGDLIKSFR